MLPTLLLLLSAAPQVQGPVVETGTPPELGVVRWGRDVDAALATSKDSGKPVFLLFQEVPGPIQCRRFGMGPLSHPLVVVGIEELFVPALVINTRKGADAQALERFGEEAYGDPMVRFLDADAQDLIPRKERQWTTSKVSRRMKEALLAARREVPAWLELAVVESDTSRRKTAYFELPDAVAAEVRFGAHDGVVGTWIHAHDEAQVVEVRFDPRIVTPEALQALAAELGGTVSTSTNAERRDAGTAQAHLRAHPLHYVPLTPMQRTRLNARLALEQPFEELLTSPQRTLLEQVARTLDEAPERLAELQPVIESMPQLRTYTDALRERLQLP